MGLIDPVFGMRDTLTYCHADKKASVWQFFAHDPTCAAVFQNT